MENYTVTVTRAEHSTILAALRYWQREGLLSSGHEIEEIATSGGPDSPTYHEPLTAEDIDALCEKINVDAN